MDFDDIDKIKKIIYSLIGINSSLVGYVPLATSGLRSRGFLFYNE